MAADVVRCVLSGSFRKDRAGLRRAYGELVTTGCQVLSPHRLDFGSETSLFVRDSAEAGVPVADLERHHLLGIAQSDFLWLHMPDGYVGASTAFELGYAVARGVPVFSSRSPADVTLRHFVREVPSVYKALEALSASR